MIALCILLLIILALMGTPLYIILLASSALGFYVSETDLSVITIELYRIADIPLLIALPLFTFTGYLLTESKTSQRIVKLTNATLGWLPSGLAIVALITCSFFTAFTGASGITIVAIGALLFPALKEAHYPNNFSLGLVTMSGSLGLLLAPSLPLILYGVIVQQIDVGDAVAIKDLFIAGIVPMLLMITALALWSVWANRHNPIPRHAFSWPVLLSALNAAKWELPLPVFIFWGVYSGFFAISEAAAITALYVFIVEVFIYKEIPLHKIPIIMHEAMVMLGSILMILASALAFTNLLVDLEVPSTLFEIIQQYISNKYVFLILLNIILLLLGAILDIFAAIIIMVPIILPVAIAYGIHPIHLGIIFMANMQIGYFTPPIGMNLFIASYRFNRSIVELYRATIPFMLVLLLVLALITYWPSVSMGLL